LLDLQDEEDFEVEEECSSSCGNCVPVHFNSKEESVAPGPLERLVDRAETNAQNACRFDCDTGLFALAGELEANIRDWNKYNSNDIMRQIIILLVRFEFLPHEARMVVCDCARGIIDSLEAQLGLRVDHPLAQGFWKVLRSRAGEKCPIFMMKRWTLDEICAIACCPGCGCEVTSNYCMACRYANRNALTTRREVAAKDELIESSELNACSGFPSLELSYTGSSSATALGRPVQMTTGVQR